jgi:NAD(P)H-dependent FMN reductase
MKSGTESSGGADRVEQAQTAERARAPEQTQAGKRIAVVIGSTRPTRICPGIAAWVRDVAQEGSRLRYVLVDLAEIDLPFLDEPLKAALNEYEHEHTRAWSETVSAFDGFVFVSPQYNWGYPAPLKNALDFLYHEWHDKPATTVTYGTRGGSKAADQLHGVLEGLHMRPLEDRLEIAIPADDVEEDWQLRDVGATLRSYLEQARRIDEQLLEALIDTQEG